MFLKWLIPYGISVGSTLITFARAVRVAAALTVTGALNAAAATLSGVLTLSTGQKIIGSQFVVTMSSTAAAQFIAPAACKVVRVDEIHGTVASGTCTYQIEKCTGTQAPGSGTEILSVAFNAESTINTVVSKTAFTGASGVNAVLAAGNRLCPKVASGSASGLAGMNLTLTLEWV